MSVRATACPGGALCMAQRGVSCTCRVRRPRVHDPLPALPAPRNTNAQARRDELADERLQAAIRWARERKQEKDAARKAREAAAAAGGAPAEEEEPEEDEEAEEEADRGVARALLGLPPGAQLMEDHQSLDASSLLEIDTTEPITQAARLKLELAALEAAEEEEEGEEDEEEGEEGEQGGAEVRRRRLADSASTPG